MDTKEEEAAHFWHRRRETDAPIQGRVERAPATGSAIPRQTAFFQWVLIFDASLSCHQRLWPLSQVPINRLLLSIARF